MLFFVDESFQEVAGRRVGALGAVAIPTEAYNHFCNVVYRAKRDLLGATELLHKELKGNTSLAKAQFRREALSGDSPLLNCVTRLIEALVECEATVFGLWTARPELLVLHEVTSTTQLTVPYIKLLHYFAHVVRFRTPAGTRGSLYLDQVGPAQDLHAACLISNYLSRPRGNAWLRAHMLQVPHYTHSAVSPGLQAADLVAYLMAQQSDVDERPELKPFWDGFNSLAWYQHGRTGSGAPQLRGTTGELIGLSWRTGTVQHP